MNLALLHPEVQQFISENVSTEITQLILKGSPFKEVTVQELANQIVAKQKAEKKLPSWFALKNTYYPPTMNLEQTSSEITAKHKAGFVSGDAIIDITGGFGVDCYSFSKQFKDVTHCEINKELSKIVAHNFVQLKAKNIVTFAGNGMDFLKETTQKFDCIYIDPSRRNETKGKVFLLKDCLPYVPPKIDFLFTKARQILIKTSPILDISQTVNDLKNVKKIQVVAVNNEVKELLFLLEKDHDKPLYIEAINYQKKELQQLLFKFKSKAISSYSAPLTYLYEPNAAILKSGGFHEVSAQFGLSKLHQHAHLYTSLELIDFPGRRFEITQCISYDKKKIKKLLNSEKANITTRNFPKTVAQIRKETKIKEGGDVFLFFTTNLKNKPIVVFCEKAGPIESMRQH